MPERISLKQAKTLVCDSHGEMREMIDDEGKHDEPAYHHVTGGEVCFDIASVHIAVGACASIFDRQLNGHVNVNNDHREQEETDRPQQRTEIAQMFGVTVDPIWTEKDLQISKEMSDNEKNQDDACDCDDHFFSNGRVIESGENIHGRLAG